MSTSTTSTITDLPFDCLYDISTFIDLKTLSSLIRTCATLRNRFTWPTDGMSCCGGAGEENAKFVWMSQLRSLLLSEIQDLQSSSKGKGRMRQLRNQLNNLSKLLLRFENRSLKQSVCSNDDDDDDDGASTTVEFNNGNEVQANAHVKVQVNDDNELGELGENGENNVVSFTYNSAFAIYNSLKQLRFSAVLRSRRIKMTRLVQYRMIHCISNVNHLFECVEEAIRNNDLTCFKPSSLLDSTNANDGDGDDSHRMAYDKEMKRIERQEMLLWNVRVKQRRFILTFLRELLRLRRCISDTTPPLLFDGDPSTVPKLIHYIKVLLDRYHGDILDEYRGQYCFSLLIKLNHPDILKPFIPYYNEGIRRVECSQMDRYRFDVTQKETEHIVGLSPFAVAIRSHCTTELFQLLLDEVDEPNKSGVITALMGLAHCPTAYIRVSSIYVHEPSWIRSMVERYHVDLKAVDGRAISYAIRSSDPGHVLEHVRYLLSNGVQLYQQFDRLQYGMFCDPLMDVLTRHSVPECDTIQCVSLLMEHGAQLSRTVLSDCLYMSFFTFEMLQFLVKQGVDLDQVGPDEPPMLLQLISTCFTSVTVQRVEWMLKCGANPVVFWKYTGEDMYASPLRRVHTAQITYGLPNAIFDALIEMLASYGVTKETEPADPDSVQFDEWYRRYCERELGDEDT